MSAKVLCVSETYLSSMHLTPEQVDQFDRDGYLILQRFFNAQEVAAMQAELQRLVDACKLRNVVTEGDGATHSDKAFNLQVCPLSPHSDLFRSLPFSSSTTVRRIARMPTRRTPIVRDWRSIS